MPLAPRWPVPLVLLLASACGGLQVVLATPGTGTGGGPPSEAGAAAPDAAALEAAHRQQRQRCLALTVAAVRAECLRQAGRDLARGLAAIQPGNAASASRP